MKLNNSGPAIFMYMVIAMMLITSSVCFILHYSAIYESTVILWIGIVSFTIMYHFWLRIIMGNVTKIFKDKINYTRWWFKEREFEKKLYKLIRVKKWKDRALTYNPELFDLKERSLEEIAHAMTKAELDHWINELISLSTIFFGFIWGQLWIFVVSAIVAMIFDSQFIIIQRYNRPRVVRLLEKEKSMVKKSIA